MTDKKSIWDEAPSKKKPRGRSHPCLIVLGVAGALVLVLIGIGALSAILSNGESTDFAQPTEFDRYEEPLYGYRISFPSDWRMTRAYFADGFRDTHRVSVQFKADTSDYEVSVIIHKFLPFYELSCKSNVWVNVAGVQACKTEGDVDAIPQWNIDREYFTSYRFVHDDIQYSIGASSTRKSNLDRYFKTASQMLDSFTLAQRVPYEQEGTVAPLPTVPPSTQNPPAEQPSDAMRLSILPSQYEAAGFKTYTSTSSGASISYPPDWVFDSRNARFNPPEHPVHNARFSNDWYLKAYLWFREGRPSIDTCDGDRVEFAGVEACLRTVGFGNDGAFAARYIKRTTITLTHRGVTYELEYEVDGAGAGTVPLTQRRVIAAYEFYEEQVRAILSSFSLPSTTRYETSDDFVTYKDPQSGAQIKHPPDWDTRTYVADNTAGLPATTGPITNIVFTPRGGEFNTEVRLEIFTHAGHDTNRYSEDCTYRRSCVWNGVMHSGLLLNGVFYYLRYSSEDNFSRFRTTAQLIFDSLRTAPDGYMPPANISEAATIASGAGREFGTGLQVIYEAVEPGTYRSSPDDTLSDDLNTSCRWRRMSPFGSPHHPQYVGHIGGNIVAVGTEIITIEPYDGAIWSSAGCGIWRSVELTYPEQPGASFSDGAYVVDRHIESGTYENEPNYNRSCTTAVLDDFSWQRRAVWTNTRSGEVEVPSTAAGFISKDCGTWTRVDK